MNNAFEVTPDDVSTALANIGKPVTDDSAQAMFDEYIAAEADRIEKAALYGNEIEEQTNYAHAEIIAILKEAGVVKP
jgi:hypothetical protein